MTIALTTVLAAAFLTAGTSASLADSPEAVVVSNTFQETIIPETSVVATDDEVRQVMTVKNLVVSGLTLPQVQKYYPGTTEAQITAIKNAELSKPQLFITRPSCNNVDFYSVVRGADNFEWCFANAGSVNVSLGGISKVCPGNNKGRVLWSSYGDLSTYYWSYTRGPVNPRNTCYKFDGVVEVSVVQIF
ncbi:hypothetical protein [Arthrobacter alpinus]|uniref:hypothetical protein n=1 Tax=Arthrobacter alpinus TaxID=656366 RepID=UPI000AB568B1|nr:hypothetical protein [Arthrobacter alpinus]